MSAMTMGVTRATAIAAANAVIQHLKRGACISQFDSLDDYPLSHCKFTGHTQVVVAGQTNTGNWVFASNTVVYKDDRSGKFPIEKVVVSIYEPNRKGHADEYLYFECTFGDDNIEIKQFNHPLHEDEGTRRRPVWQTDGSPDAWATRFR